MGIPVDRYYASETDKFAIRQTMSVFPNTIQLGDIRNIRAADLEKIDLFIGGSPCQGFSFAGKRLSFDDPRSVLFFEYARLWNEIKAINPKAKFLLENVKMKKRDLGVISDFMGLFPVYINSSLVSAQNRNRYYWTNFRTKKVGLFNEVWTDIPQPEDRQQYLIHILQPESEVDKKYHLSQKMVDHLLKWGKRNKDKGNNFKAEIRGLWEKSTPLATGCDKSTSTYIKMNLKGQPKPNQDKASCFTAGAHTGGNHSDMDVIFREGNLRRLTPFESQLLQTVPEWYEWVVSNTQIYKMLGNGWTIEVIKHILKYLIFD